MPTRGTCHVMVVSFAELSLLGCRSLEALGDWLFKKSPSELDLAELNHCSHVRLGWSSPQELLVVPAGYIPLVTGIETQGEADSTKELNKCGKSCLMVMPMLTKDTVQALGNLEVDMKTNVAKLISTHGETSVWLPFKDVLSDVFLK